MNWDYSLLPEQINAASHLGTNVRLLAGPGTGKTLVLSRRILYLMQELNIPANQIFCLTFTRAAAYELRKRVKVEIGEDNPQPIIQTLHSFSLRQLLRNSAKVVAFPQPLRVADDWEERYIVQEDLKRILGINKIREVQRKFNLLSSDWETLAADSGQFTPDPRFVGAWQSHRNVFRFTLRAELVYQLKKALEQIIDFEIESPISHLLIDEYQDLNQCDLSVIKALQEKGCELFVAGDDDQSIYLFRNAHPQGIRNFIGDYPGSEGLFITTCMRCDKSILQIAEFVADQDYRRIRKGTKSKEDASLGEVSLYVFKNQYEEARNVVNICKNLIENEGYLPSDILILSRSNTNNAFSRILEEEFELHSIPFSAKTALNSFNETYGRKVLAVFRLLRNPGDDLAWRTLIQIKNNNIGKGIINKIVDLALEESSSFFIELERINADPELIPTYGNRISNEIKSIKLVITQLSEKFNFSDMTLEEVKEIISSIGIFVGLNDFEMDEIWDVVFKQIDGIESINLMDFLQKIEVADNDIEQEISKNSVNMLTMHKAKGLTSKAVIILGVEDEIIPGRQQNEPELGDERRLLFVSLSRAKHKLIITYCNSRSGQQSKMGRQKSTSTRQLTRFLKDSYLVPIKGGY